MAVLESIVGNNKESFKS
ncbi:uncharacterized protein FRV6_13568 [Fusarium oxysporum]|uniref:Uncharacterized protein n=2 Tax=Fusarium oxysporum TaxID=5507 RepID=A0A2H3TXC9_FUSOX|nr:hypothetical protein FOXB_04324 [Fusarium oxysporum f. sp. conglutinans Fo5176]SCO89440.1 uncharacterized protein FRV6_13568 [Fusarium oxysporum]